MLRKTEQNDNWGIMRTQLILRIATIFMMVSLIFQGLFSIASEQPLNQTVEDKGELTPASFIHGHVTHQRGRYILGPGDVVEIKIKDLSEFDQKITVGPDGFAPIHPFGEYNIAGIDAGGLELWLEEKLKFYLLKPEATVTIAELRPATVYITGEVKRPGAYQLIRNGYNNSVLPIERTERVDLTLTNVLTRAGGVTDEADIENITVMHSATKQQVTYNLFNLLAQAQGDDIILMPGDKVIIPKRQTPMDQDTFNLVTRSTFYQDKFPVVVLGSVHKQGEVLLDTNNNSLNAALGLAGGFLPNAKKDSIIVQRPTEQGAFEQFRIDRKDEQFSLRPGDLVFVADSTLGKAEKWLRVLGTLAAGYYFGASGTSALYNMNSDDDRK